MCVVAKGEKAMVAVPGTGREGTSALNITFWIS